MLRQHEAWKDQPHLKTRIWMMAGLILSGHIHRSSWAMYVQGRAIPLVWKVIEHPSAMIAYEVYVDLLDQLTQLVWGQTGSIVVLADRGFADTDLLASLSGRRECLSGRCPQDKGLPFG